MRPLVETRRSRIACMDAKCRGTSSLLFSHRSRHDIASFAQGITHKFAVVAHGTDERMFVHELEERLRHVLTLQHKNTHGAQTIFTVGMGRRAPLSKASHGCPRAQGTASPCKTRTPATPRLQHRLGPTRAADPETRRTLTKQILGVCSTALIFSVTMCWSCVLNFPGNCACSGIPAQTFVEARTQATIPTRFPHRLTDVLRQHRVIRLLDFDMAVPMHALPLTKARQPTARQR